MRFSREPFRLRAEVYEIAEACRASQATRGSFYRNCWNLYLYGSNATNQAKANKIMPTVDRRTSFLYAPDQVRFWAELSKDETNTEQFNRIESVTDAVSDYYADCGLDLQFDEAVKWSQVYNAMHIGLFAEPRAIDSDGERTYSIQSYLIHPEHFGVFNESVPDLNRQEAVCMTSFMTEMEIKRKFWGHPKYESFSFAQGSENQAHQGLVFVSSASATSAQGFASPLSGGMFYYDPDNGQMPRYAVHSLYCWDDLRADWRVFTMTEKEIIWDHPITLSGVSGRLPFIKVCPQPLPFYYWGRSLVDSLGPLQEWYTTRLVQTDILWQKILRPPKVVFGVGQLPEDREGALNRPGGINYFGMKGTQDMQEFQPQLPNSALLMLDEVANQFVDMSGMRQAMFGKQEPGNRTEGMQANMLRVSASEVLRIALNVERQVEDAASLLWSYIARYSKTKLPELDAMTGSPTGNFFLPAEFSDEVKIKVDGHSSSPIYVQDHAQMIQALFRMGAIDQKTAVRLLHPPQQSYIESKLERIQFAKTVAEALAKIQQQQKQGASRQAQKGAAA